MAETEVESEEELDEKKPSKLPIIIGVVLALVGGGGGFFAAQSGLLGGGQPTAESTEQAAMDETKIETIDLPDVVFVEVPPLTVSLGPNAHSQHLKFRSSLEVPNAYAADVEGVLPRVQDVLNSYLRALEPKDIEAPGALVRLRGQMLRRVKLVAGEDRVSDLLVLEFVLN
ncbi:MAG: flagellar basal body-associated FliL family protein [Pelagimonas sp.]|nr:flagellar basal body-associated FliL family protein [Pelagimonas sp.]